MHSHSLLCQVFAYHLTSSLFIWILVRTHLSSGYQEVPIQDTIKKEATCSLEILMNILKSLSTILMSRVGCKLEKEFFLSNSVPNAVILYLIYQILLSTVMPYNLTWSCVLNWSCHRYKKMKYFIELHYCIIESPILRRLTFASRYDVSCYLMRNAYNRMSLRGSLAQRRRQLQQVCAHGRFVWLWLVYFLWCHQYLELSFEDVTSYLECNMSVEMQPWYECRNNEMTIYWPTDKTFSVVYKAPPEYLTEELRERLVHNETEISTVRIQTLRQP